MNISDFKIVADSSADMYNLEKVKFQSAPLKIITFEKEFVDDEYADLEYMVNTLSKTNEKSSTACPAPGDWLKAFGDSKYVFCISITSQLSGSYNAACIARDMYMKKYADSRVFVIDSLSAGPELRLIAEKLEQLILQGLDFDEICNKITSYTKKTGLLFMLESMRNLANNGRVNPLVAKAAGLLGIRVVGRASDKGVLELLEKSRGQKKAFESIVNNLKKLGATGNKIYISHCFNEEGANVLKQIILQEFKNAQIKIYRCGALCSFYAEKGGMLIGFEK